VEKGGKENRYCRLMHLNALLRLEGVQEVTNISEKKHVASKVKPRKDPTVLLKIDDGGPSNAIPVETSVPAIQAIAVNLCGVPPDDVSTNKLLAPLQEEDDSDHIA
jgi:hypothetical protein